MINENYYIKNKENYYIKNKENIITILIRHADQSKISSIYIVTLANSS